MPKTLHMQKVQRDQRSKLRKISRFAATGSRIKVLNDMRQWKTVKNQMKSRTRSFETRLQDMFRGKTCSEAKTVCMSTFLGHSSGTLVPKTLYETFVTCSSKTPLRAHFGMGAFVKRSCRTAAATDFQFA